MTNIKLQLQQELTYMKEKELFLKKELIFNYINNIQKKNSAGLA